MKKAFIILIFSLLFLTSCSSFKDSTLFIHAAIFDEENGEYIVKVICESNKEDNKDFFIIDKRAPTITKATELIRKEHPNCYFATCNMFLVPSDCSQMLLECLSSTICDSNVYPSKSAIICYKNNTLTDKIKSPEFLSELTKEIRKDKINCVKFFSLYAQGKTVYLPCYSDSKGLPNLEGKIKFRKKEYHNES